MMPAEENTASTSVWPVATWCVEAHISQAFYFKHAKAGTGPRIARCGRRTLILESPREYFTRLAREAEAAEGV
jgi:hypothetical protein